MSTSINGMPNGYGSDPYYAQQIAQSNYQNQGAGSGSGGINLQQLMTDLQNGHLSGPEQDFVQKMMQMLQEMEANNEGGGEGSGGGQGGSGGGSFAPSSGEGQQTPSYGAPSAGVQKEAVTNPQTTTGATSNPETATPSTSSTSSTSTPSSSTSGNASNNWGISGKEGLGISPTSANGNGQNMGDASWYSNWSLNPTSGAQGKFIPTVDQLSDASSQSNLESAFKNSGSKLAFGFNEPDNAGQANISPSQAASAWGNVAGAAQNTGTELTSPSVTNSTQSGQGLDWLKQFMNSDTTVNGKQEKVGDTVSAINLHWYGSGDPNSSSNVSQQVSDLKNYLQQAHQEFPDKPIVLSEVGLNANGNSASSSPEFMQQVQQMLNGSDMSYVQLYAPYGAGTPSGN